MILLNGEPAALTDVVHAGDSISFTPARPGADAARTLRELLGDGYEDGLVAVNGAVASLDDPIHAGDDIWVDVLPYRPGGTRHAAEEPAAVSPAALPGPPLHLVMNGAELDLPGKASGDPYYLMDLLEYSGIDFNHLDKPVELLVNGGFGQFSQRLYENDDVVIRQGERQ